MDLSKILAISGKGGLFKIVSQSKGAIIVESLKEKKKFPVFAAHRSSVLEEISVFTNDEDVPLKDVLWKIYQKENGGKVSINIKSEGNVLLDYFEEVLPDFDKDRVYPSDIKKILGWYNILLENDLISEPKDENKDKETEEESAEEKKESQTKVERSESGIKTETEKAKEDAEENLTPPSQSKKPEN
ncbi:MAG: DUF5606 domain-containing protein [Bacteroidota bacterium]